MWKDAAILILELQLELMNNNISIHDAHPWNILFDDYCKPVFIDIGGIMPNNDQSIYPNASPINWPAYYQFANTFFNALMLFSWNQHRIARLMFMDYQTILKHEIESLVPRVQGIKNLLKTLYYNIRKYENPDLLHDSLFSKYKYFNNKYLLLISTESLKSFVHELKDFIQSIELFPSKPDGIGYISQKNDDRTRYYYDMHGGYIPSPVPSDNWTAKNQNIYQLLKYYQPSTVLDMCSSTGWFALLAARNGARVVAFDVDESCIVDLHINAKKEQLNILPLLMNFKSPTPAVGINNRWLLSAKERYKCDMVLLLAVVHHLVFTQWMNFEQIATTLAGFTNKVAIVEFVHPTDKWVSSLMSPIFHWYNLDNFILALNKFFSVKEVMPSFPDSRVLLVCEKKP
jgi:SAM-dependent methyltransferase